MNKLIITVLGKDRPGIISLVTNHLYELECNLENVNQMILQNEFAGFFVVEAPATLPLETLQKQMNEEFKDSGLVIHCNEVETNGQKDEFLKGETFLMTTIGPDQKGLVARFSKIIARYHVNIENLKAVFKGGNDPLGNIMSYQIFITPDVDQKSLFNDLRQKADELNLDIRIQHKNIFEATNKI
ncbi:MAG: amino acid-binding protein [Desulfobacteraceae bacterium]|nr:amino acid-binding protein [Desulfobacteraceae bacterium]